MPTYEYLCQACSHRFETWQKMSDEPLTICPACGGSIRRVLFAAGIVFKGHGFYKTDYNSNGAISSNNGAHDSNGSNGHQKDHGDTSKAESSTGTGEKSATSSASESKSAQESKAPAQSGAK